MKTKDFVPVLYWDDKTLLVLVNWKLYFYKLNEDKLVFLVDLPVTVTNKVKYLSRYSRRLLRLVNITAIKFSDKEAYIFYKSEILLLSIKEKSTISFIDKIDKGTRPLSAIFISNNAICDKGVYYGDYASNANKDPMSIYCINDQKVKKVVYTFDQGEINHIHTLLKDDSNNCIWIFTGDFDDASAIWKATDNFKTVMPVARGNQLYRSCVATNKGNMLYYATDSPFEPNCFNKLDVTLLDVINNPLQLASLNGSVIYGSRIKNKLYFSSCVESTGQYSNRIEMFVSRKLGRGILSEDVVLYEFDLEKETLKEIYRNKKDILPFVLFQFGTFTFPMGEYNGNILPVFHIGTKARDLKTLLIPIE